MQSDKYILLMYFVHSMLESRKNELVFDENTTVENFRENEINNKKCLDIHEICLTHYDYELSWNQIANGINLFLNANQNGR